MSYTPPSYNQLTFPFSSGGYTPPPHNHLAFPFGSPPGDPPVALDDSYTVDVGVTLVVAAPGVLANDTDPNGLAITAIAATSPAHGTAVLSADGSFSYLADPGFVGSDSWTYRAQNTDGLDSGIATITVVVSLPPTIRHVGVSSRMPWGIAPHKLRSVRSDWGQVPRVDADARLPWGSAPRVDQVASMPWQGVPRCVTAAGLPWANAPRLDFAESTLAWQQIPRLPVAAALAWRTAVPKRATAATLPWRNPPRLDAAAAMPWVAVLPRLQQSPAIPWRNPPQRIGRWWMPWGQAPDVRWFVNSPGVEPPEPQEPPFYVPPRGDQVDISFLCPQLDHAGNAVPIPFGPAACYFAWPKPRRYIVLNSAAVVRLPERTPIPVNAIQLASSIDDAFWSVSLTLADPSFEVWLKPDGDGPRSVEININGHVWTAIIESWSRQSQFPGHAVTVQGRSRTALLSAPYAPPRAKVQTAERLAQQLVDEEVDLTGFTVDYGIVDWTVPGGVWSYDAQTPIAAIRLIAAAAGAVVQSHPWDDVLQLRPRYAASPWVWSVTAPDKQIQDDFTPQLTAADATTDIARYTLGDIPLWPPSASDKPGLVLPLQLIEFVAAAGWKAMATGVRISAERRQQGSASVLVVSQTITLEAPPPEPVHDYVLVSGDQVGVSAPVIRDGRDGSTRLPMIVDKLITQANVQAERGRNAIAGGGDAIARSNVWLALSGLLASTRLIKGNVTANNADGSCTIATTDGATIRARKLPGQAWTIGAGVFVENGRIVDGAPSLPGVTQYV